MLVKDVMKKNPVTVTPDTSVLEAKKVMTRNKINKLPVVGKNGSLVGILTRNDLIKVSPSDATTLDMFELGYVLSKMTVEKIMHKDVKSVGEKETVEEAARLMADYTIGCLPVLKDGVLTGIVTETDLFKVFIDLFDTRSAGVRATIVVDEKPGQLNRITQAIANLNGNIVAVATSATEDLNHRKVTIKASNITVEQYKDLLESCQACIEDIRSV